MADTPRHLPHKALIPFGVQGYVVQDKRAAQAGDMDENVLGFLLALQQEGDEIT